MSDVVDKLKIAGYVTSTDPSDAIEQALDIHSGGSGSGAMDSMLTLSLADAIFWTSDYPKNGEDDLIAIKAGTFDWEAAYTEDPETGEKAGIEDKYMTYDEMIEWSKTVAKYFPTMEDVYDYSGVENFIKFGVDYERVDLEDPYCVVTDISVLNGISVELTTYSYSIIWESQGVEIGGKTYYHPYFDR